MNRFILTGVIRTIKFLPDSVIVYVDDMEKGYVKPDGTRIDDLLYTWKVIFKANPYRNFIAKYFNDGMLVDIDARMRPFAVEKETEVQGYSCIGLSIQRGCNTRASHIQEMKMVKESQERSMAQPNLEEYNKPDF